VKTQKEFSTTLALGHYIDIRRTGSTDVEPLYRILMTDDGIIVSVIYDDHERHRLIEARKND